MSENYSAFVSDRYIMNNSLIALEMFHSIKNRCRMRRGYIAMKLDMSKVYDRVEWTFLQKLILKLIFSRGWVDVIISCVLSTHYSFVVNGDVCEFVKM